MSIENERKITILHNSIGSNKQIVVKNGWVVIIDCSSPYACSGYGGVLWSSMAKTKKEDFTFVKSSLDMFVTPAGFKPATF
ncbi:hypothetical protein [Prevotella sp.]|uniref:hypothetical protein n=1 Tax=Prevotella sp. TaxID=59823 RepID=UPI003080800D